MDEDIRPSNTGKHKYKVINQHWGNNTGWQGKLAKQLEEAAADGWKPILLGDSGGAVTVICEKYETST